MVPPRAISDAVHLHDTIELVDRLMALPRLTAGQGAYLETFRLSWSQPTKRNITGSTLQASPASILCVTCLRRTG